MNRKSLLLLLLVSLLYAPAVMAQDTTKEEEEKSFTLSGSVDAYFHTPLKHDNPFGATPYGPSSSFANLKGFSLGMVNLIGSYAGEKVGFTADLVFGPRGVESVFGTATGQAIVNQLFTYIKLGDKVTLNMGQFNTFVGYEVISPAVNFNYSTSYMFSWGPFNHTGLRADFDLGGGMSAKLAVMNPTDIVEFNPVNTYTFGGQFGYTNDNGGAWLNLLYGDQDGTLDEMDGAPGDVSQGATFQVDVTTGWNLTETFYLGLNATYRTVAAGEFVTGGGDIEDSDGDASGFYGVAIYPKITLSESFALGLRAEYFGVKNSYIEPFALDDDGDGNVIELTLSGNYKVGALTIIPELRIDKTSDDSFLNGDDEAKDLLPTLNLAAVYKF